MAQPPPEGEEPGEQVAEVGGEEEGAEGEGGVGQHAHGQGRQAERGEGGPDGGALRCNQDNSQYWPLCVSIHVTPEVWKQLLSMYTMKAGAM